MRCRVSQTLRALRFTSLFSVSARRFSRVSRKKLTRTLKYRYMYSALPERCAQRWPVALVDEDRTTFWGIIEELVSESSKPAELRASSTFSFVIPEDALYNGTRSVAVAKEKGERGMEAFQGLIACQCCRKFGSCVTFTIPCQEDKLAAEVESGAAPPP